MKAGYKIEIDLCYLDNFVLVSNILGKNLVKNEGLTLKSSVLKCKNIETIGFWRIKRK